MLVYILKDSVDNSVKDINVGNVHIICPLEYNNQLLLIKGGGSDSRLSGKLYSIQLYVVKFVCDFLMVPRFHGITLHTKLTTTLNTPNRNRAFKRA